jgi:hypothetical protein
MSQPNEIGRLIAVAAKAALEPLGCDRLGKTRTWISDQRFWLIIIEFQPSSWEKGSYLNVGAMWLWHAHVGHSFNAGYRIANFVPFFNSEQFSLAAASLAAQAANEVQRLRNQFQSLRISAAISSIIPRRRTRTFFTPRSLRASLVRSILRVACFKFMPICRIATGLNGRQNSGQGILHWQRNWTNPTCSAHRF